MAYAYFRSGATQAIDYTPGSAVAAGDVVVISNNVYFAPKGIDANALGSLQIGGVWRLPKTSGAGTAISLGVLVYWDATYCVVTTTAGSNKKIGVTVNASLNGDSTQDVLSIPQAV